MGRSSDYEVEKLDFRECVPLSVREVRLYEPRREGFRPKEFAG